MQILQSKRSNLKRRNFEDPGVMSKKPLKRGYIDLAGLVNVYDGKKTVNHRFTLAITGESTRYI